MTKELTEHDLNDAERLAERLPPDPYMLNAWRESMGLVDQLQSTVKRLVREVRGLRAERAIRLSREAAQC